MSNPILSDPIFLSLFLLSTFFASLTSGVAGFAAGLVVSGVWLQILTPQQTAVLIAAYGVVNQSYTVWKLRRAFSWRRAAPLLLGSLIGVPLGTALVAIIDPAAVRFGVGILLIVYSAYGLLRPALGPVSAGTVTDAGAGLLNGLLGGLTGLGGVVVTIWVQLRNWPKDEQRAVFQPIIFTTMAVTVTSFAIGGAFTLEIVKLFLIGLPAVALGLWSGLKLYGHLNDAAFRKVILALLLVSGVSLVVSPLLFATGGH
jgi:uncharacterized membrane protein YfcA